MLTPLELSRYTRQLVLPEVGLAGQEKLRSSRVFIVGAGGLGSPAALYLAAAGVGVIGLIDDDAVELSNLHRQILHRTSDVGKAKAASGTSTIRELNPHVEVRAFHERLTRARALDLFGDYDLVIDGSDNYPTRYAVNDACAALNTPWVYGSVERFAGQVSVFGLRGGPCYRCLFPDAPSPGTTANCEEIGVLGPVPGVIGCLQALEALKCLLGVGQPLAGQLLQFDFLSGTLHGVEVDRRKDCPTCGGASAVERAGAGEVSAEMPDLDVQPLELAARLRDGEKIRLLDIREPWETAVVRLTNSESLPMTDLPAALGTLDPGQEVVLYCHHGSRSSMAAEWLREQGFRARSLAGGIDRWSREIDPALPRY